MKLEDMMHMAIKVEQQLKRKSTSFRYGQNLDSSSFWKSNWRNDEGTVSKTKSEPCKKKKEVPGVNKGKSESQTCNHDIRCFRCLGVGHIASQSPNKRMMIMQVDGEVETESEDDPLPLLEDDCDEGVESAVEGESLMAKRALGA